MHLNPENTFFIAYKQDGRHAEGMCSTVSLGSWLSAQILIGDWAVGGVRTGRKSTPTVASQ